MIDSRLPLIIIFLLLMSSCARVPSDEKAGVKEALSLAKVVEEVSFPVGEWPDRAWWNRFENPTLTHLIESALSLSPTLQKAEARLRAAYQMALQKKATLYPEVDLEGSSSWQHLAKKGFFRAFAPTIPAVVNDITLGFSFSYEFDFWGKNRDLFQAALGRSDALEAERQQAELILTTSIAYTYAELQFLLRKKQILEQIERNTRQLDQITLERLQHGVDAALQQLQSQVSVLDSQVSIVAIDQQIQQDQHRLKALSALGQNADVVLDYSPLKPFATSLPENLELDLIARRPDLAALKAQIEAASKDVHAAKTDFYPNINLMGLVGLESVFASQLFRGLSYSGTVTPALHLPIFTAGRLRAQLLEKVAQFDEAVYAYNELILQVAGDVADRLTALSLLQKQISLQGRSWEASQQKVEVSKRRLEHALDDLRDFLDLQNGALESEMKVVELEYGRQLEAILLIRALGGGYHDPSSS